MWRSTLDLAKKPDNRVDLSRPNSLNDVASIDSDMSGDNSRTDLASVAIKRWK